MSDSVNIHRPDAPRDTNTYLGSEPPSPEVAAVVGKMRSAIDLQQERVAELRGYAGQLRTAIRRAHRSLLEHEHVSPLPGYPIEALEVLSAALAIPFPPQP